MERETFDAIVKSAFFRDYAEAFRVATGAPLLFIPVGETAKHAETGSPDNPFCLLAADWPAAGGCGTCRRNHHQVFERAGNDIAPVTLRCFAGLQIIGIPVALDGRHIGTLLSGRILLRKPTRRGFHRAIRKLRLAACRGNAGLRARLEQAYFSAAVISSAKFEAIGRLATDFARHLSGSALRHILASHEAESPVIRSVKGFIQANATRRVTLRDAARRAHLSPSHLCRLFKRATGMTMTNYVNRLRIENAKDLLLRRAGFVKQVAYATGFQSVSQFNRAFRKFTGTSPGELRHAQTRNIPGRK